MRRQGGRLGSRRRRNERGERWRVTGMREGGGDREKGRHRCSESFWGSKGLRTPGPSQLGPEVGTALPRARRGCWQSCSRGWNAECLPLTPLGLGPGRSLISKPVGWVGLQLEKEHPVQPRTAGAPGRCLLQPRPRETSRQGGPSGVPSAQHSQPHSVLPLGDRARGAQASSQPTLIHRMQPLRSQHSPAKP